MKEGQYVHAKLIRIKKGASVEKERLVLCAGRGVVTEDACNHLLCG
jgi:hypothetical protein